jgi:hypothetical protein
MRAQLLFAWMGLLLGSSTGCVNHMEADGRMRGDLEQARQEVARHHQVAISAQTLEEIRVDVTLHEANMDDIMGDMEGAMEDMAHCSGSGMGAMMAGMDGMRGAMMDHVDGMDGATTMEGARALCEQHVTTMTSMMEAVEANMGDVSCM